MSLSALRIGIVGLGQIGGSIATRLSMMKEPPAILGFDLRPDLLHAAQERHIIARIARSEAELVRDSDLIVIALPIGEILAFLRRQQEGLRQKVAVTDTGSLKLAITHLAAELGMNNFVGGHPLAGTEKRGIASWSATLFEDANYFLACGADADRNALRVVTDLVGVLGAKALPVDPERHDRIFAFTSGLPHIMAYSLMRTFETIPDGIPDKALFSAPSFNGATRVTSSDPEMVFQALWNNQQQSLHRAGVVA